MHLPIAERQDLLRGRPWDQNEQDEDRAEEWACCSPLKVAEQQLAAACGSEEEEEEEEEEKAA